MQPGARPPPAKWAMTYETETVGICLWVSPGLNFPACTRHGGWVGAHRDLLCTALRRLLRKKEKLQPDENSGGGRTRRKEEKAKRISCMYVCTYNTVVLRTRASPRFSGPRFRFVGYKSSYGLLHVLLSRVKSSEPTTTDGSAKPV